LLSRLCAALPSLARRGRTKLAPVAASGIMFITFSLADVSSFTPASCARHLWATPSYALLYALQKPIRTPGVWRHAWLWKTYEQADFSSFTISLDAQRGKRFRVPGLAIRYHFSCRVFTGKSFMLRSASRTPLRCCLHIPFPFCTCTAIYRLPLLHQGPPSAFAQHTRLCMPHAHTSLRRHALGCPTRLWM